MSDMFPVPGIGFQACHAALLSLLWYTLPVLGVLFELSKNEPVRRGMPENLTAERKSPAQQRANLQRYAELSDGASVGCFIPGRLLLSRAGYASNSLQI